jgi:hypothetical protein
MLRINVHLVLRLLVGMAAAGAFSLLAAAPFA